MLHDRGYEVTRLCEIDDEMFGSAVMRGRRDDEDVIDVYMPPEDKVSVKYARTALEQSAKCIIVSIDGPTSFTKKECEDRPVQFFLARRLCANVTRHALVPKHERVDAPPDGIAVAQLPKLLESDAIVRHHAWPKGTIVKITRVCGGHEPIPYFRVVV